MFKTRKNHIYSQKAVHFYIVYEIYLWPFTWATDLTLGNSLFGVVKLTKNADRNYYKYSGYGIGFDSGRSFTYGNRFGKKVIIFGADISSSVYIDNRKKDILIVGKAPMQGLGNNTFDCRERICYKFYWATWEILV